MLSDAVRHVQAVVDLMGSDQITDDEIEERVLELTGDELSSRRLIDWIPEVFAFTLIAHHLRQFELDWTFQAQSASDDWQSFDFKSEPITPEAGKTAAEMLHHGPKDHFQRIAQRSSALDAANNALKANPGFKGILSGPAFIGIPAEAYSGQDA